MSSRVERVDAHEERPVALLAAVDEARDQRPRVGLLRRRDGILEVEDERVGAGRGRLRELARGIAGDEQERAQFHGGFPDTEEATGASCSS